jgi:hypothetical protein
VRGAGAFLVRRRIRFTPEDPQNLRGPQLLQMSDMQVAATQEAVAKGNMMQQIASELYADMSWGL